MTNEKILLYGRFLTGFSFASFSAAIGSILIIFDVLKSSDVEFSNFRTFRKIHVDFETIPSNSDAPLDDV